MYFNDLTLQKGIHTQHLTPKQNTSLSFVDLSLPSDQRLALEGLWVPHRRQEELPPVTALRIIARSRRPVHQSLPRVTRIRPAPENPRASRNGLQRRRRRTLIIPTVEGVSHGSGQQSCNVYDHAVHAHVTVRCN